MEEISLSELIQRTNDCSRSFEHRPSTTYQYQMAWKALKDYFVEHDQVMFSKPLAELFIQESKAKLDAGIIKKWRYKLNRIAALMLIECFETGHVTWRFHKEHPMYLHGSAYIQLFNDYLHYLEEEGKSVGTIQTYQAVSR
jgi:hypothetical protein